MGRATTETLTEAELRDIWTLVEMGEDVDKTSGREFEDEDGPKTFEECPLDWKDGKATEAGCGRWWGIGVNAASLAVYHDDTVAGCNELLVRAGLPRLTVVDGRLEATFDVEGVNAEQLEPSDASGVA